MKHFLSLADLTPHELPRLLDLAVALKTEWKKGGNPPYLQGKTLGMIFQKPSLRTRISFDMAMLQLGGHALYLSPNEIQLGQRESVADVARVLGRYVDAIMARVFSHKDVLELARYAGVPVANGLSDYSHPCQGLADLLTVYERFGKFKGIKIAYIGDGNNVANSLIFGCTLLGADFAIASPIGYEITGDVVAKAQAFAVKSGSNLYFSHDPNEAVREADVIYTDVWTSMGQEAETQKRLEVFSPRYQINAALVAKARRNAIVMHCLPAHRGQEITDEVADGPQSVLWDQAENRMHAQKAILVELLAPDAARQLRVPAGAEAPVAKADGRIAHARPKAVKGKSRPKARARTKKR
ncbi:MAG TPA: ornithine carbamoyltransferase [Anaerolineae bacterium]|nr:ornithine carbamoyltransferase [Anaerolineae bacterium]